MVRPFDQAGRLRTASSGLQTSKRKHLLAVDVASNGQDAMAQLEHASKNSRTPITMILTDLVMPKVRLA